MITATVGEALFHGVGIFAQESDIEHRGAMLAGEVGDCKSALFGHAGLE
jgi:hypothetical protein